MRWEHLLFAHWPVAREILQPLLPAGLEIDTYAGEAWIAVVPFRMNGIRWNFLPPIPGTTAFDELNVRTYVRHRNRPGVWFFTLDATSRLSVRAARALYHLPYQDARMKVEVTGNSVDYRSSRTHKGSPAAELEVRYGPTGPPRLSAPGTLEHWLTERYGLYAADRRRRLFWGGIDHEPWLLQSADAAFTINSMTSGLGISLPRCRPLLHYAAGVDVRAARIRPIPIGDSAKSAT